MAFKDILVHMDSTVQAGSRLDLALALAKRYQAHLIALNVRDRTLVPTRLTAQFGAEMDAILARGDAEAASAAKAMVEARAEAAQTSVEWRDVAGDLMDTVALHARYCDLVVVGQTVPDNADGRALPDSLVVAVGRPMLVVPHAGQFPSIGRRVLVAWNASREATRAVHDALPFLREAELVHVIAVNPEHGMAGHGDIPGADICQHLSRHGVKAVCEHIRSDDIAAGAMLLNRVADEDCDMIVMGGYGRSRLREMVLGGATRHLLEHMTVPILMSH
ncbi:universal stress protein [Paramagnetospirillum kuznetsovii]|uniref:Universal stress protein n=1 Tax=Paramagnetospirillum kuznetsovii TaxID=2053833 RepID=A0A364NWU9_9PROT|nr:universal stress protein [Paramagnetospirillum kuznetsovii]RAU21542.1 universal stress protein [Paramagnetospirillum kuznetsovii]